MTAPNTVDVRPTLTPVESIRVPFAGDGAGEDELSWGQWEIWLSMRDQESALPIGGTTALAAGTTVADIVAELAYLLGRYQSMRTRLRFDRDGRPRQVLSASGEITLEIYDAGDADGADIAGAVHQAYYAAPFDYTTDWPVRMAVVRKDGVLTHMAVLMCHIVTDGTGATIMLREAAARTTTPVAGMQPLEQARWQRSEAGRRQNRTAMRYWENLLRTIPAKRLSGAGDPRVPRHWQANLSSPALLLAVRSVCARTRIESSPVLLAAFAVALARLNGINPVVTRQVVSNRFRPGLGDVVCMVAQNALCVLDVAGISLDEAVNRAAKGALTAYKHAYFDAEAVADLIATVTEQRGPDFNIGCFFNDRRVVHRDIAVDVPVGPGEITARRAETRFDWVRKQHNPVERMFIHVDDVPDMIHLTLDIDTDVVSPADGEALLRGVEAVAIEMALDPHAPTGVAATKDDDG